MNKKIILEEVKRIHEIMGISPNNLLTETENWIKFFEKLGKGSEEILEKLKNVGYKNADEIVGYLKGLSEKAILEIEDLALVASVGRTLFPELVEQFIAKQTSRFKPKFLAAVREALLDPEVSTKVISDEIFKTTGTRIDEIAIQAWRDSERGLERVIQMPKVKPEIKINPEIKPQPEVITKPIELKLTSQQTKALEDISKDTETKVLNGETLIPSEKIDILNPQKSAEDLVRQTLTERGVDQDIINQSLGILRDMVNKGGNTEAFTKAMESNNKLVDAVLEMQKNNKEMFDKFMKDAETGGGTGGPTPPVVPKGLKANILDGIKRFWTRDGVLDSKQIFRFNVWMTGAQILVTGLDSLINGEKYKGLFNESWLATVGIKVFAATTLGLFRLDKPYTLMNVAYTMYDSYNLIKHSGMADDESNKKKTITQEEANDFVRNKDGISKFLPKGPDGKPMNLSNFTVTFKEGEKGEMDVYLDGQIATTLIKDCTVKGKFLNATTDCVIKIKG
jgi:hypothetical protein